MADQYSRMKLLFGPEALSILRRKRIALFGLGGVGAAVLEGLSRSGVGTLDIFDSDVVDITNLNRQLIALHSTIGLPKVEAAARRVQEIDPQIVVNQHRTFYLPDDPQSEHPDFSQFDYVVDAIDTVTGKIGIVTMAQQAKVPVISCMGTGNRTDPAKLCVCDLFETKDDPLAKVMRKELRRRGITRLKVVCSTEPARKPFVLEEESAQTPAPGRHQVPGSSAFVPPAAGLIAASVVVRDLLSQEKA